MSTDHHTPIPQGAPGVVATVNAPLAQLDQAIKRLDWVPDQPASPTGQEFLRDDGTLAVPEGTGDTNGHIIQSEDVDLPQRVRINFKGRGVKTENSVDATEVTVASREVLTENRTYYVSTAGDDDDDGLTEETAVQTPQVAVNKVLTEIDGAGFEVTIQLLDGTHASGITVWGAGVGIKTLNIIGNELSASSCKITMAGNCIVINAAIKAFISGFQLSSTGYNSEIYAAHNANVTLGVMKYDTCGYAQINCNYAGRITLSEDYEVIGGGVTHLHCDTGGEIFGAVEATFTGTPDFSAFVIGVSGANVNIAGMTWTGAVTGQRFLVHNNGVIYGTSDLSFIPGDSAGEEASGGKYVGDDTYPDALQVPPSWSAPTLINSWVNFGSGYNEAGYFLDQFGIVHLRGLIKSGTIGTSAFVLPTNCRPANTLFIATVSADLFGKLAVYPDGNVTPANGSNSWFSLDGISFPL